MFALTPAWLAFAMPSLRCSFVLLPRLPLPAGGVMVSNLGCVVRTQRAHDRDRLARLHLATQMASALAANSVYGAAAPASSMPTPVSAPPMSALKKGGLQKGVRVGAAGRTVTFGGGLGAADGDDDGDGEAEGDGRTVGGVKFQLPTHGAAGAKVAVEDEDEDDEEEEDDDESVQSAPIKFVDRWMRLHGSTLDGVERSRVNEHLCLYCA